MQSGRYSIEFRVLSDSSDTSHTFYSRGVFMAVFAVDPEREYLLTGKLWGYLQMKCLMIISTLCEFHHKY